MAEVLVGAHAEGFATGGSGYVYTFGGTGDPAGGPSVGDFDILFVNSNTIVDTPSGFTKVVDATNNQGCYWFIRQAAGGEGGTVTITTSGDENTQVTWERWAGLDAFSGGDFVRADNANGTALPDAATGTLAAAGMLLLYGAALHNFDGALAATPIWTGVTELESVSQGPAGASSAVVAFTAYKSGVGTASEDIDVVTWTNNARNRYATWVAFTVTAGGADPVEIGLAAEVDTAGTLGRSKNRTISLASEVDTAAALARSKNRTIGQATEVDTASTLGRSKNLTLGRAVEVDTAAALTRSKTLAIGRAGEVDTAGAFILGGNVTLGRAVEVDAAAALTRSKVLAIGRAVEVDSARPLIVGTGPGASGPVVITSSARPRASVQTSTTTARLEVSAR